MHPEVQEPQPGPAQVRYGSGADGRCHRRRRGSRRDQQPEAQDSDGGILTVPILLLAFDSMIPGLSFDSILSPTLQGWLELLSGNSRHPLGGRDVLHTWLALACQSQPEHVYSHHAGCGCSLRLQRGRSALSGYFPRLISKARGSSALF